MWRKRNKPARLYVAVPFAGTSRLRPPARRPLPVALCVAAPGILCGLLLPYGVTGPLLASMLLCVIAWIARRRAGVVWVIWMLLFFLAWAHAAQQSRSPSPRALGALMERPREHMHVRGQIMDDPVLLVPGGPRESAVWRMTLQVREVNRRGWFERASGTMDIRVRDNTGALQPVYGDRWEIEGVVTDRVAHGRALAWLPPYRMTVGSESTERVSEGHGSPMKRFSYAARRAAAVRLGKGLEAYPETAGLLRALLLGYRHELPEPHHRLFAATGTLHVFAISGLHIAIFAGLILVVVRAFGVPVNRTVLWVAPFLVLYVFITGLRPSALRACTMALAFGGAYWFHRRPDVASAWALAALGILAFDPAQLTAPGFLFSFVVVAGLVRMYPVFYYFLSGRADWLDDLTAGPPDAWRHRARKSMLGLIAASLAAWLASAPLTAATFNLFSPVALIGNLLVIPAAFIMVLTGLLTLTLGAVWTLPAEIFNHANRVVIETLVVWVELLERIPNAYRHVPSPGLFLMGVTYALIFWGAVRPPPRWRFGGYALLCMAALYGWSARYIDPATRVYVLDAGDGHAALVRAPGVTMLYDAGPAWRADRLVATLRDHGVNRLNVLAVSHASAAHVGGAVAVMQAMPVDEIWITPHPSRSPVFDRAISFARDQRIPLRVVQAGDAGAWTCGTGWEVLHPPDGARYRRAADASMAIRICRGTRAVLLTGGAGADVEASLASAPRDATAPVWVIGNQGRDGVAGPDGFHAIRPEAVVLAAGAYNRYGPPPVEVLDRLAARDGVTVWRTDEQGPVEIRLSSRVRWGRRRDQWALRGMP